MRRILYCLIAATLGLAVSPRLAAETLSLAGPWQFTLDRADAGINDKWFLKKLPDRILLPGILEAQNYGDLITPNTPWVLSLYDHFWFERADYAAYTNVPNVKVPFLCQPMRHYVGVAWYERSFEAPEAWRGQRISLLLERPHWKTTVWLDNHEIGSDISLCTPHKYELGVMAADSPTDDLHPTQITPGKHRLTIRVDNRMILPYRPDAHSVSDSLDNAWNGIVGRIELRATPQVWLEQVQVYPHMATKSVSVTGHIGNLTGLDGNATMSLAITPLKVEDGLSQLVTRTNCAVIWKAVGGEFRMELPMPSGMQPWDEFHPNLYRLTVQLRGYEAAEIHFGLREIRAAGTQLLLNEHPIYLRGTHFGGDFPLTGYPPTDVGSWRKLFLTCKEYGLNHLRFHSWCPPEAAFTAADELGFYLQVECGMWNEFSPGGAMEKMLYAETDRLLTDYGNHPSLLLLSASNEAHGRWQQVLPQWVEHYRRADPRRLYTPDTGWVAIETPGPVTGADYLVTGRIGGGRTRGESGWFGRDYEGALAGIDVPVVAHELGQWCAYPDFKVIQKFTGFMRPENYEIFRNSAMAHGQTPAINQQFAHASGRFQLECYKEEIEANLRTRDLAGFQLLDLHDYTGQGTALVGLLDPFWESKGYVTPAEFKEFCAPTVPLARLNQRTFTTAEVLKAPVEVAHFGAAPLDISTAVWQVVDTSGVLVRQGNLPSTPLTLGKNIPLGTISVDLSQVPAPAQYALRVILRPASSVSGDLPGATEPIMNQWNFWLYPATAAAPAPSQIRETSSWDEATQALSAGSTVLFTPRNADLDWNSPPLARVPIFWNALMGPTWSRMLGLWCDINSPALAEFPTEANCDWQWTELLRNTRAINLDALPRSLTPLVSAIDDWNRNYKLGLIFEAKAGKGKLLVCAVDLSDSANPVAQQLHRSLLDYMAGEKFQPKTTISLAEFASLHFDTRIMQRLGATVSADGRRANELIDGDPNTFWSSADARGNGPNPPHEILISFPHPVAMSGVLIMPRQNQREHQGDIREFSVATSDDGTHWQERARGHLASTFDEQQISFPQTATARYVKLIGLSGYGTDHSAALAEVAVRYAGPKLAEVPAGEVEYKIIRTASPDIDAGDAPNPAKKRN